MGNHECGCGGGGCGSGGEGRVPLGMSASGDPSRGSANIRRAPAGGDVVNRRRRDEEEVDEGPLAEDIERFSGVTRTCPACKKEVFDDSAVCYHCGHAFERTTAGSSKTPLWVIVTVGLLVTAFVLGTISGVVRLF